MKQNDKQQTLKQETIVNHLKHYGFVFANSEIYGGLANAWDFGPLGVILKKQIKDLWWKEFVTKDVAVVGLDSAIIYNPAVWQASGHLSNFSDPLIDCKACKSRFRADKLIEAADANVVISETSGNDIIQGYLVSLKIHCPKCNKQDWTEVRNFNLMFKTFQGVIENDKASLYLRPETAQGIFVNFKNIQRSMRLKLPFGVGQIGKSFRNEITPGNFIFRTREFEQMELEYFCFPNDSAAQFEVLKNKIEHFLKELCGLNETHLKLKEHAKEQLSHYALRTIDFEYLFPQGWSELWGLANRTDYDLKQHQNASKKDLTYLDVETKMKVIPYVIEPSVGVERLMYAILCDAYEEEQLENDTRVVLHLNPALAPYQLAVLPLSNKLKEQAKTVFVNLVESGMRASFDTAGSIGKRYRRQDAIGTPYCITYDFDSESDQSVTIRDRDTMKQERIKIVEIKTYLLKNY